MTAILHVLEPADGGVATHVRSLVDGQLARGHRVGAIVPARGEALATALAEAGAEVFRAQIVKGFGFSAADLRTMRRVGAVLRGGAWDLLHAHDSRAGVLGRPVARTLGIPVVYSGHSFAHLAQRAHGSGPLKYALTWAIERSLATISGAIVVPSAGFAEDAIASRAIPRGKVAVVHNGYDPPAAVAPDPALASLRSPVVGFLSRMTAVKDPLALVDALGLVQEDFRAALVGDGELADAVIARAAELGIGDRVVVRPFNTPGPALAAFDVYVLPSTFEPFGIGLLEGMGAGLPVVGTRVGGIPEVIDDGVTGLVVPSSDPPALAAALSRLLRDPGLRTAMGAAGRERLLREFSVARMAERTDAVYARLLAR